jgi:hypothetical protein
MAREAEQYSGKDRPGSDATELSEVVDALFSELNLKFKSVLNQQQVVATATALAFASEYDVDLIYTVAENFLKLKVSEKGKGLNLLKVVLGSFLGRRNDEDSLKDFEKLVR